MCDTCGCNQPGGRFRIIKPGEDQDHDHVHTHAHSHDGHMHSHEHTHGEEHDHTHPHDHAHVHDHEHYHDHEHSHASGRAVTVEQDILSRNILLAERNRGYFEAKNIFALNLVSSPGSGKTSILERTIRELQGQCKVSVIEGDQQTSNDADRIRKAGAPSIQINTGDGCHLDAEMVNKAFRELNVQERSVLFIENVGNLVCPALFDLGETKRVVIVSVTEGEDKPLKYPNMFLTSNLCLINKIDLLPYLDFSVEQFKRNALRVNHHLEFIELSARSGEGFDRWTQWVLEGV